MANPVTALLIFFSLLVICAFVFTPKFGVLNIWKRSNSDKKKILIEDSLKFIYDFLSKNKECSKESLAAALKLTDAKVNELLQILTRLNLITVDANRIEFTEIGKSYAIKIVRIHRLLEKYLAEETSVKEDYWHILAEDKEHSISDEEAESLSAKLGNPLIDPHGDPIPARTGEHFENENKPLIEMKNNEIGIITHIEDEPPEIYSRITALNLYLGSRLKVFSNNEAEVVAEVDGRKINLPLDLAGNIFLSESGPELFPEGLKKLSDLKTDEEAFIVGISKAMRGQQRRRLLDFGFVPGTKISVRLVSFGNDPVAYDIRNTTVALRKQQSDMVFIKNTVSGVKYGSN